MRWKEKHRHGDTRVVKKFLWRPKYINGETRFFEKASWVEKYFISGTGHKWSYWTATKWV